MDKSYFQLLAEKYHTTLPDEIRAYLHDRGLDDDVIERHLLGWNGYRITIPIFNREGEVTFFKLAKHPLDTRPGPKIMASPGANAELYGWEVLKEQPSQVIICEGEFDRLVLETNGFQAVTSTGGAGSFRSEWAAEFKSIPHVYVCFDRDDAGRRGALRVARMIPHAKLVELPQEVDDGGDITDLFVRLGWRREAFERLLDEATPAPPQPEPTRAIKPAKMHSAITPLGEQVERIKRATPIEKVVGEYLKLRTSGNNLVGLCPFHEDHTPSLTVYPANSTFHCYGCGKHGDVIKFVQEIERMSFKQALDTLDRHHS
jgi:DNA primase